MHFTTPLIAAALLASATALPSEDSFASLLERQAPGTPEYACHAACGGAITTSRGASPCEDTTFLDNYAACLACAGLENLDIWQYYGGSLTGAGEKCGLSTEPEGAAGEGEAMTSAAAATTTAAEVTEMSSPSTPETTAVVQTSATAVASHGASLTSTYSAPTAIFTGAANLGQSFGSAVMVGALAVAGLVVV